MNFNIIYEQSLPNRYAIRIDRLLHPVIRNIIRKTLVLVAIFAFALSFGPLPLNFSKADGLFFAMIFFYLVFAFLEFFYCSMKNDGVGTRIKESYLDLKMSDWGLSSLLERTDDIDISRALFESKVGQLVLLRAGLSQSEVKKFVFGNRSPILASAIELTEEKTLSAYVANVYDKDKSLQDFLSSFEIEREEFVGAAKMVEDLIEKRRRKDRYWSRENLGAIPSIGTSWGYGVTEDLGHFSVPFDRLVDLRSIDVENGYRQREVMKVEEVLTRSANANAIIIVDDERTARDIVARLLQRIKLGVVLPSLENSNIVELDWNALMASFKDKSDLEQEIIKILNEAARAGNVLVYLRDLPAFMLNAKSAGLNIPSIIAPYLESESVHILAHSTNSDFHYFVETSPALLQGFERIMPEKTLVEAAMSPLIERALELEKEYKVLFAYESIHQIAEDAERYIVYGDMPGKALDLMSELPVWAESHQIYLIRAKDVSGFVSEKTGIKSGEVTKEESDKILHLEEEIHERVVGQDEAVRAISSAIRKSRSNIVNPKRPIASFLFLGPTGVGKTEVSKALAASFFGHENSMIRLDMSEYNSPDALGKLLGSFGDSKSGLLPSLLKDKPYGVLLLDEFEKSTSEVQDLFLQILDEGMFTDALGKSINCRNQIIIATSNAGSDKIWQVIKDHKNLTAEKDSIINSIIEENIFKPELLNRFDDIILFHPLLDDELASVARLELEKLKQRLKEQSFDLVITHELINFLVEKGSDPQFGARSINRAVKNIVEDIVSRKILEGKVKAGDKIEITPEDLL